MEELLRRLWVNAYSKKISKEIKKLENEMVEDPETIQDNLSTYEHLNNILDHGIRIDDGVEPAVYYADVR